MKASKFSDAQKAFILKQGDDGVPVAEICRKAGISQATYFNWQATGDQRMRPELTFLLLMMSATTVIAQQELVPPERQEEDTQVTSDLFLANACAKRLGWKGVYPNTTNVFVTFAKQNNFPDAENLAGTTANEIAEKDRWQSAGCI